LNIAIRRGLKALGDHEFPMPSNMIAGIARIHRELSVDVVEIVPP